MHYKFRPLIAEGAPLVFLGRIQRIKGAHHAIAIAKQTGRRLILAGNHNQDGPEAEYWRQEILPEIGHNGISYVGPVNDHEKDALLGGALALVAPIEWEEPFGIVFIEALACGTPVITCPRGAAPEIIRDGIEGFLINGVEEGCRAVERLKEVSGVRRAAVGSRSTFLRVSWSLATLSCIAKSSPFEMKRVLIISPRFPPINAPDHHRVRTSLPFYAQYGWEPTVLALTPDTTDSVLDPCLTESVPPEVEVHRVPAWTEKRTRLWGLGNWTCARSCHCTAKAIGCFGARNSTRSISRRLFSKVSCSHRCGNVVSRAR